jgi:hypothetical protein
LSVPFVEVSSVGDLVRTLGGALVKVEGHWTDAINGLGAKLGDLEKILAKE